MFGKNPKEWPAWVRFLVSEEHKELDRAHRHDYDLELFDEAAIPLSDEAVNNLTRAEKYPEMDFEEFAILNQ
jgi:hypothetical protein